MNAIETLTAKPTPTQLERQEADFVELEQRIAKLRAFIKAHEEQFAQVNSFNARGWTNTNISFDPNHYDSSRRQSAKEIAALFGKDGWTRKPDPYSCGSIDWHKEVDGIKLTIKGAETIKPLLPEVKL